MSCISFVLNERIIFDIFKIIMIEILVATIAIIALLGFVLFRKKENKAQAS